jgi:DNA-binding transcriptional MocR family regulator
MQQGHFAAHIRRMRQLYRDQRNALAETLMRRAAGVERHVRGRTRH